MENLSYLRTEYAREKMIESYDREAKERELAEGNLTSNAVLKTIVKINERYIKINGIGRRK